MRLIYIMRSLNPIGGIERTLTDKANWLVDHGHDVMFITYQQGTDDISFALDSRIKIKDLECSIYSLYKYSYLTRLFHYIKLKRAFHQRFCSAINSFLPDIVVVPIPNAEDFVWDIVNCSCAVKIAVESHISSDHFLDGKSFTDRLSYILFSPIRAIRKANLFIALTEHDAYNWKQKKVRNVKVIPNPLTFFPTNNDSISKVEGRIIAVGRLANQKRFDRLIEAFSIISTKFPIWHVDIYGDGQLHDNLENQIKELGLSNRVIIHHFTSNIIVEYQKSQFLVLSSDYEGFGLVVTEAMACGIPVVSTDCPFGPSTIIDDGQTGLLSRMDASDLAKKMEWMIVHETERKKMGERAYRSAALYRKDLVVSEWEKAYMSVIK